MSGHLDSLVVDPAFDGDVDTSMSGRKAVSRDASIFEVMPAGIIAPRNKQSIQAVVRWATEQSEAGTPVTLAARVGGTCMSGGSLTQGYIRDLKRYFNFVGEVDHVVVDEADGADTFDVLDRVNYQLSELAGGVAGIRGTLADISGMPVLYM